MINIRDYLIVFRGESLERRQLVRGILEERGEKIWEFTSAFSKIDSSSSDKWGVLCDSGDNTWCSSVGKHKINISIDKFLKLFSEIDLGDMYD